MFVKPALPYTLAGFVTFTMLNEMFEIGPAL